MASCGELWVPGWAAPSRESALQSEPNVPADRAWLTRPGPVAGPSALVLPQPSLDALCWGSEDRDEMKKIRVCKAADEGAEYFGEITVVNPPPIVLFPVDF